MTDWISRADAARLLGVTVTTVGNLIARADLHPRAVPSRRYPSLDRAEVEALAERREAERLGTLERRRPSQPRHPDDGHEWWSAAQVAARLGISKVRVAKLSRRGKLPFVLGPRGHRSYRADLIELVAQARQARDRERT